MSELSRQINDAPKRKETRFSFKVVFALIGMMIVAALIGILVFTHSSMGLDEAQSLFQVSRNVPGLLNLVAQDVHVPGYHLLLHFWLILFGNLPIPGISSVDRTIVVARYLSLAFFVALIPAIYILARQFYSRRVGIFAAILVTISPFLQWYGSNARMYSMLALITVLHQIAFVKLYKKGYPVHWIWFVITAMIGVYTHYFFWFVLLTEAVFYFATIKRWRRYSFIKFVVSAVLVVAVISPWLLYVKSLGLASNTQPDLAVPSSQDLFNAYAQFIFGFQVNNLNTVIVSAWPILVLLAFFALRKSQRITPDRVFFILAAILPVVAAFVISILITPFFLSRYLVVSLPALFILIAWILSNYGPLVRRIAQSGLIAVTIALLVIEIISPNTPVKEDYKQAVNYVSTHATGSDVIVATAPFTVYPIEYYYNGPAALTTQPIWNRFAGGKVPGYDASKVAAETKQNTDSYNDAWLILSYDQGYNAKVLKYYQGHYTQLLSKQFSPGLVVYKFQIRYT